MRLHTITVFISYRFDAGDSIPRDRQLCARVIDGPPVHYGPPISPRKKFYNFIDVRNECVLLFNSRANKINFIFDPRVLQAPKMLHAIEDYGTLIQCVA